MNLMAVMVELGQAVATIDGVKVLVVGAAGSITVPSTGATALVPYPRRKAYDGTYGRGMDTITQEFMVVVPKPTDVKTVEKVTAFAAGSGPKSVKAAIDGYTWTTCHGARVEACEFDVVQIAGIDYMAAVFDVSLWGSGA